MLIGVFDSGIGGLSILQALRAELPHENFTYIADSGHAPYGERDSDHVLARSRAITTHLAAQGIKALVIACNTATAAAIDQLRLEHPGLPIIGVEPALKPAALLSRTGRVGVMATRATLASARFKQLLLALADRATFILQPCDGLADAIERGLGIAQDTHNATEIIAACAYHTQALGRFGPEVDEIDTLVLGCTHYPFASETLRGLLGPDVVLVFTGEAVARQLRRVLPAPTAPAHSAASGRIQLFATGPQHSLQAAAKHWLDFPAAVHPLSFL
ncbi:MAG: glutamate racemase [Polaromonas sp.]|nr:glutamate racemase [Polaromonas sp.]